MSCCCCAGMLLKHENWQDFATLRISVMRVVRWRWRWDEAEDAREELEARCSMVGRRGFGGMMALC